MLVEYLCPCCGDNDSIDEEPKGYLRCENCGMHLNLTVITPNCHYFDDGRFHVVENNKCKIMIKI